MSSTSPRPILKRTPTTGSHSGQGSHLAVHFPPSPRLTTHTFSVYSSSAYDRSPIVVAPNSCALPERGCPGRTYTLEDDPSLSPSPSRRKKEGYRSSAQDQHPRALFPRHAYSPPSYASSSLPPLIPDLSSESDESDGLFSPPLDARQPYDQSPSHYKHLDVNLLSFLPYPSSPPQYSTYPHPPDSPGHKNQKSRRPRERRHDSSRAPDRIPSGSDDVSETVTPTKTSRKCRVTGFSRSLTAFHATSGLRIEDDGCLGGF